MTLLHEAVDAKKMDVRLVERNVLRGVLSQDDVEKNLKKLPDDAANAEYVNVEALINDGAINS
jgi:hypothetical protein